MPRFLRMPRWLGFASASLVLVLGTVIGGVAFAAPANASILNACDADQTLPLPETPADPNLSAPYSRATQTFGHTYTVISNNTDKGAVQTPAEAYNGAGLHWTTFGLSNCSDIPAKVLETLANITYTVVVAIPVMLLGLLLNLAMSTGIGDWMLQQVQGPVQAMHDNMFLRWVPAMLSLVLIGALWRIARGQGRKALGDVGWAFGALILAAALASPSGLDLVRSTNDTTSSIAGCLAFGFTSGCADDTKSSSAYTGEMEESLAAPAWASGALGSLADTEIPDSLSFTGRTDPPQMWTTNSVTVPKSVIPALNAGHPTWAETLRWTQTYTASEMAAMNAADGADLRCTLDASPVSKVLSDPATDSFPTGGTSQLCSYKWIVHDAMLGNLAENQPNVYAVARGATNDRLFAALSAVGIMPLALGIMVIGLMTLFYQLELVALFLTSPVVALMSVKSPQVGRKWANQVASTLIQRLSVGLVLGLILWLVQLIIKGVSNATDNPLVQQIPLAWHATIVSVLTLIAMCVGFAMFGKLRELMHESLNVEHDEHRHDGLKKLATTAGTLALGAGAGALAAGTGNLAAGAAKGLLRSSMSIHRNPLTRTLRAGTAAGKQVKKTQLHEQEAVNKKWEASGKDELAQRKQRLEEATDVLNDMASDGVREQFLQARENYVEDLRRKAADANEESLAAERVFVEKLAEAYEGVSVDDYEKRGELYKSLRRSTGADAAAERNRAMSRTLLQAEQDLAAAMEDPDLAVPAEFTTLLQQRARATEGDPAKLAALAREYQMDTAEGVKALSDFTSAAKAWENMGAYQQTMQARAQQEAAAERAFRDRHFGSSGATPPVYDRNRR